MVRRRLGCLGSLQAICNGLATNLRFFCRCSKLDSAAIFGAQPLFVGMARFYPGLLLFILLSCTGPEPEVEEWWNPEAKKRVAFYDEVDGVRLKVREERYYPDGTLTSEGDFDAQGRPNGLWHYYYENGQLWSLGHFDGGKKVGEKEVYWPNGQLRYKGQYGDDKKTGHWVFYHEDGRVLEERDF